MEIKKNFIQEIEKIIWKDNIDYFLECCQKPLKKSIKININKIESNKFQEIIKEFWWRLTTPQIKVNWENYDNFYIDRDDTSLALWKTFFHLSWFFYIQEIAASIPAKLIDIKPWDKILDISAAPWGKTTQIWDYLLFQWQKPWFVVANDVNKKRAQSLAHNLNRMGIYNTWITSINWFSFGKNIPNSFDHVLVDAPCSWEWTSYKSDFSLKTWKKQEINKICWTQFQLLVSAAKALKIWWTLIYSTCTLNPYENELNVKKVLDFFEWDLVLEETNIQWKSEWITHIEWEKIFDESQASKLARFWPHVQETGWFFVAKIKKVKSKENKYNPKENKLTPQNPFKLNISEKLQKQVWDYLYQVFWIKEDREKYLFLSTTNQVYVTSPEYVDIKDKLNFEKIWTPIFKINSWRDRLRPLHWLWTILWDKATKNFVELNYELSQKIAFREDINKEEVNTDNLPEKWYIILRYQWYWISVWKILDWVIKNKYIKI